jgi:D-threo-aldose 1-dehydrogenase
MRCADIGPEETILHIRTDWKQAAEGHQFEGGDSVIDSWRQVFREFDNSPPLLVSIEDADEDLSAAIASSDRDRRIQRLRDVCRSLNELKAAGKVKGVGIAAWNWEIAREICDAVALDFIMLIGCFTIMRHPPELLDYLTTLADRQIAVINAGVFHGGFLTGGQHFDGRRLNNENVADQRLLAWRKSFAALCHGHGVAPAHACIQFALSAPGVTAVALNTSHPDRVTENVRSVSTKVPRALWASMKEEGLLTDDFPHLG